MRYVRRKGDPSDMIFLVVVVFFLAVSFLVVLYTNDIILTDVIEGTKLNDTSSAPAITDGLSAVNTSIAQRGFVIFFSLLVVGVVASSFLIRVHPVFIFIYIMMLIITVFVSVFMGNAWDTISANSEFQSIADDNPMINFIMNHIVMIAIGVGALSMLVVFGKIVGGRGGAATPPSSIDI